MIKRFRLKRISPLNRYTIKTKHIIITKDFLSKLPSQEKISRKYQYYKIHKTFMEPIIIDKNYILLDGYTSYLIAKMFGVKRCEVRVQESTVESKGDTKNG